MNQLLDWKSLLSSRIRIQTRIQLGLQFFSRKIVICLSFHLHLLRRNKFTKRIFHVKPFRRILSVLMKLNHKNCKMTLLPQALLIIIENIFTRLLKLWLELNNMVLLLHLLITSKICYLTSLFYKATEPKLLYSTWMRHLFIVSMMWKVMLLMSLFLFSSLKMNNQFMLE